MQGLGAAGRYRLRLSLPGREAMRACAMPLPCGPRPPCAPSTAVSPWGLVLLLPSAHVARTWPGAPSTPLLLSQPRATRTQLITTPGLGSGSDTFSSSHSQKLPVLQQQAKPGREIPMGLCISFSSPGQRWLMEQSKRREPGFSPCCHHPSLGTGNTLPPYSDPVSLGRSVKQGGKRLCNCPLQRAGLGMGRAREMQNTAPARLTTRGNTCPLLHHAVPRWVQLVCRAAQLSAVAGALASVPRAEHAGQGPRPLALPTRSLCSPQPRAEACSNEPFWTQSRSHPGCAGGEGACRGACWMQLCSRDFSLHEAAWMKAVATAELGISKSSCSSWDTHRLAGTQEPASSCTGRKLQGL